MLGKADGVVEGTDDGKTLGFPDGINDGPALGIDDGNKLGSDDGFIDGAADGISLGSDIGFNDGSTLSNLVNDLAVMMAPMKVQDWAQYLDLLKELLTVHWLVC